jgi:hypothetical protein
MQQSLIFTIFIFIALIATVIFFTKEGFKTTDEEYELIKKYLLNESPLYGKNKPKIWIHSIYDVNARNWSSFQSRNSRDLNQPFVEASIQSVIDHCSRDFNILLINDETFSKLIPKWEFGDLSDVADPKKSNLRNYGLLLLLYYYGGIIVPNSFICMRNLISTFGPSNTPFVVETINRTLFGANNGENEFAPSIEFMGVRSKRDATIRKFIDESFPWSGPPVVRYKGDTENRRDWEALGKLEIDAKIRENVVQNVKGGIWVALGAELFGLRTVGSHGDDKIAIRLEELMEDDYLDLSPELYGVLIDRAELLVRPKYQWLAYVGLDENGMLNNAVRNILAKYLNGSLVDGMLLNKNGGGEAVVI